MKRLVLELSSGRYELEKKRWVSSIQPWPARRREMDEHHEWAIIMSVGLYSAISSLLPPHFASGQYQKRIV